MPRKLVKLVGFDYEEDEGEVQFRDGVQTAEITLLSSRRRHTQNGPWWYNFNFCSFLSLEVVDAWLVHCGHEWCVWTSARALKGSIAEADSPA